MAARLLAGMARADAGRERTTLHRRLRAVSSRDNHSDGRNDGNKHVILIIAGVIGSTWHYMPRRRAGRISDPHLTTVKLKEPLPLRVDF
jgi:hypothetical protein